MNETLLFTVIVLCILGVLSAVILYFVARKFHVEEDPRLGVVESMLPGANCGGCGFPGCKGMANALVKNDDISSLYCPAGGAEAMNKIATYLGKAVAEQEPQVAVIRCAGRCDNRIRNNIYNGASSCAVEAALYGGETACVYGCLGQGDCVDACTFGAMTLNPVTGMPEVDQDKCTACGACVKACPKGIIELRKKGVKNRRIYICCSNKDKGAVARKACVAACIGCGKCVKTCPFGAITVENHLAYIDPEKCRLCRKCVAECPTGAIVEVNFPPRPVKQTDTPKQQTSLGETVKPTESKTIKESSSEMTSTPISSTISAEVRKESNNPADQTLF